MSSSTIIVFVISLVLPLIIIGFLMGFVRVWIKALAAGVSIGLFDIIGMKLRNVPYSLIIDRFIRTTKAGVPVTLEALEAHFLAGGNVEVATDAFIRAAQRGIPATFSRIAQLDLAGRDVMDIVETCDDLEDESIEIDLEAELPKEEYGQLVRMHDWVRSHELRSAILQFLASRED